MQSMDIDKGASVSLSANPGQVSFFVSRQPMRGKITVVGQGTITAGSKPEETSVRRTYDIEIPETLEFVVSDPQLVPSSLTVYDPQKWSLGRAPFADLNFTREEIRDVTETIFIPSIKSGTLSFNDTAWPVQTISEQDILSIHKTGQSVIEIGSDSPLIHVALNGVVEGVTLGQGDARRQLAPSYLEYLYNKKKLSFFWASVVGIWGLIWGIRKIIFR